MTMMYYMAASREMPTGSFGRRKLRTRLRDYLAKYPEVRAHLSTQRLLEQDPEGEQWIEIYESLADMTGLDVSGPLARESETTVFRQPWVYHLSVDGSAFDMNGECDSEEYKASRKCFTELLSYLQRNMRPGEEVELYSCWCGPLAAPSEPPRRELDKVIDLSGFRLGPTLRWQERQYVVVVKPAHS